MEEAHKRSAIKALSWRILATFTTTSIVFIFTGEILLSVKIGFFEVFSKLFLYYVHERIWGKIKFGKLNHPLSKFKVKKVLNEEDELKIKQKLNELGYLGD